MSNNIIQQVEGELRVSSLTIADRTEVEHRAILQLVRAHHEEFEEFGGVAFEMRPFETAGGTQRRDVAQLNEQQATLLITYMRNSGVVRAFKIELVKQFYAMRQALAAPKSLEQRSLELLGELNAEVQRQAAQITELAPRADAWDDLASGDGTYSVGDAAKMLQQAGIKTGRDRLFQYMYDIGWLFKQSGRWQAMQSTVDAGRLFHKPQSHRHPETGETVLDAPQVRVTMKGLGQLRVRMLPPLAELDAA